MVQKKTRDAVLAVLEIDSGADDNLKAAVASLLEHNRAATISTPKAAQMLGVCKRTLIRKVESGDWPLAIDYESANASFCYLAQVLALKSKDSDVPTIDQLGVVPRARMETGFGKGCRPQA